MKRIIPKEVTYKRLKPKAKPAKMEMDKAPKKRGWKQRMV